MVQVAQLAVNEALHNVHLKLTHWFLPFGRCRSGRIWKNHRLEAKGTGMNEKPAQFLAGTVDADGMEMEKDGSPPAVP